MRRREWLNQPKVRSNTPAAWERDEPFALLGAQHHGQAERKPFGDPVHQLTRVAAVHTSGPHVMGQQLDSERIISATKAQVLHQPFRDAQSVVTKGY